MTTYVASARSVDRFIQLADAEGSKALAANNRKGNQNASRLTPEIRNIVDEAIAAQPWMTERELAAPHGVASRDGLPRHWDCLQADHRVRRGQ